jgi:hypothetical protein
MDLDNDEVYIQHRNLTSAGSQLQLRSKFSRWVGGQVYLFRSSLSLFLVYQLGFWRENKILLQGYCPHLNTSDTAGLWDPTYTY